MDVTVHEWFLHVSFIIFMSLTLTLTCNQKIETAKEKVPQRKVEKEEKIDAEKKSLKGSRKTDENKKSSERKRKKSEGKAKAPQMPLPSTPLQQQHAPPLPNKAVTLATNVKPVTTVHRPEAVMVAYQARVDEPVPEGWNENTDAGVTTVPVTPALVTTLNNVATTLKPKTTMMIERKDDELKSDMGDGEYEDVNLVEAVAPSMLKETEAETKQGVVAAPSVELEEKKVAADQSTEKKETKGTVPAPEQKKSKLKAEPAIVNFSTAGGKLNIILRNEVGARVAFKVKCSNNHEYGILPIYGFIKVSETASLEITRLPGKPKEDKMVILWEEAKASSTDAKDAFTDSANIQSITVPLIVTSAAPTAANIKVAAPVFLGLPSKPGAAPAPIPAQPNKPAGAPAPIPAQPNKPAGAPTPIPAQPSKPAGAPVPIPAQPNKPTGAPVPIPAQPNKPAGAPVPIPAQPSKPAGALVAIPAQPNKPAGAPALIPTQPSKPAGALVAIPAQPNKPAGAPAQIPAQSSKPAGAPLPIPAQPSKPAVAPAHVATQPNKLAAAPPATIPAKQIASGLPPPIPVKLNPVKPST